MACGIGFRVELMEGAVALHHEGQPLPPLEKGAQQGRSRHEAPEGDGGGGVGSLAAPGLLHQVGGDGRHPAQGTVPSNDAHQMVIHEALLAGSFWMVGRIALDIAFFAPGRKR